MSELLLICIISLVVLLYLGIIGMGIANYVMTSLSVYTLAKRRGIKGAWLSWIPPFNTFILGRLAEDYDLNTTGIKRKWGTAILILISVLIISSIVYILCVLRFSLAAANYYVYEQDIIALLVGIYCFIFVLALVSLAQTALSFICLFKVFESTRPEKAFKYIMLSIFVPFAQAFCLVSCKDKGYEIKEAFSEEIAEEYTEAQENTAFQPEDIPAPTYTDESEHSE